jgi:hypothetical protein
MRGVSQHGLWKLGKVFERLVHVTYMLKEGRKRRQDNVQNAQKKDSQVLEFCNKRKWEW